MYSGREDEKNILGYLDFSRLNNVIKQFPGLNIDVLSDSITSYLLYIGRSIEYRETLFLV